jgi:phosphinothricin tripeptide acetyl hydrolase
MASSELEIVVGLLRSNPPLQGDDIHSMRASMDALTGALPPPEGVTLEAADAGGVPAEWATLDGADSEATIVYFHGGGYTLGSIQSHRPLMARLARATGARMLSVGYRLAPEHPYPAAVEDALAAYRFVLASGVPPSRIAIAGDSAGGGLTAACLVALRDAGDPLPAAGVCISAWLDLSLAGESWRTKADVDPLVQYPQLEMMARAYLAGADPKTATASPLFADLAGLPPLLVQVGSSEVLLDDSTGFAERARAAGVEVELDVWDDMIHVWHAFADLLPEAREAIDGIAAYLAKRLD